MIILEVTFIFVVQFYSLKVHYFIFKLVWFKFLFGQYKGHVLFNCQNQHRISGHLCKKIALFNNDNMIIGSIKSSL